MGPLYNVLSDDHAKHDNIEKRADTRRKERLNIGSQKPFYLAWDNGIKASGVHKAYKAYQAHKAYRAGL